MMGIQRHKDCNGRLEPMAFKRIDTASGEEYETTHIRCVKCGKLDPPPDERSPEGASCLVEESDLDAYYRDMERARSES